MLMTLEMAQKFKASVSQEELDGLEASIRGLTNNKFQVSSIRYSLVEIISNNLVILSQVPEYLQVGDTIELVDSINDGLYVIKEINGPELLLDTKQLIKHKKGNAFVIKIKYPADVILGVQKLLRYDEKMEEKVGVKSESIARMSVTYYDMVSEESLEGFPASLLKFLDKYKKLRWS